VISANTSEIGLTMQKRLVQAFRDRQPDEARNIRAKDVELIGKRVEQPSALANNTADTEGAQRTSITRKKRANSSPSNPIPFTSRIRAAC